MESRMDVISDLSFLCCNMFARYLPALLLRWNLSYLSCWMQNCVFLFMMLSNCALSCLSWICVSSEWIVDCRLLSCLIFSSSVFSNCCCCFFLNDEYEIIMPFMTALPVSQRVDRDISGESLISRKDAHSLLIRVVRSGSSKSEELKRHLAEGLICDGVARFRDTGA